MYMCELVCMNVCMRTHFCMHGKVGMAWELFLSDKEFPPPAGEILPPPFSLAHLEWKTDRALDQLINPGLIGSSTFGYREFTRG